MAAAPCTIRLAAAELGVAEVTVRRWLACGAPCVRPGECGRGRGALVDIEALRRWRASLFGVESVTLQNSHPDVESAIARGLLRAYGRGTGGESDPTWRRLNDKSHRGALILADAWTSIIREIAGREPRHEDDPPEIQQLRRLGDIR